MDSRNFPALALTFLVGAAGCGPSSGGYFGNGTPDLSVGMAGGDDAAMTIGGDDAGPQDPGGPCDDQAHPCAKGSRCLAGSCIPDNGTCASDAECENDSFCDCTMGGGPDAGACMGGVCVPWGNPPRGASDPTCQGGGFAVGDFKPPVVSCHWTPTKGETGYVLMTPVVADLDGDGKAEVIFATYEGSGALVAIHHDCTPYFEHPGAGLTQCSQLAVADLDGDKVPEIIGLSGSGDGSVVVVFDHQGNLQATAPSAFQRNFQGDECSGPAVADVDGDGVPEILVAAQVLHYKKGQLTELWNKPPSSGDNAHWGTLSTFADLDGDGKLEVISGLKVFDGLTGADKTPAVMGQLGGTGAYPQVADFNGDKKPDILLVQSQPGQQQVAIVDFANNKIIFGPYTVAGGGWGGPGTVADFDGDGVPDFGTAGSDHYYVYAMKCARPNKPGDCQGPDPGVLWERATHDVSSGGTASSVFDFNGDGKAEVVYRDECWLRVMNGPDGKTVFAQQITSGTALEMPVVADVDNDGHADLIVPSDNVQGNDYCQGVSEGPGGQQFVGSTLGVFILRDPMNRWMPSRGIWNQHTYHIGNINDDGTVPKKETPNWTKWNNFRQNVQGLAMGGKAQPDLTGGHTMSIDNGGNDCKVAERLWANLCNRGAAPAPNPIYGTFYDADPRKGGANALCTGKTTMPLQPGACEAVFCDWMNPPQMPTDVWFRANDDGNKAALTAECDGDNDLLFLPGVQCFIPG